MAIKTHIVIDQGATFSTDLNLTDENGDPMLLYNYTVQSQMRKWYTSSNAVTFTANIAANTGVVTIGLTANQTSAITPGRYVYDVELTDSQGVVSRIVEGIVTVTPQATR